MKNFQTEHDHQVIINRYCEIKKIPMYANPNGVYFPLPDFIPLKYKTMLQKCIQTVIKKMKLEGAFKKGLLDFTIPVKTEKYGALYIELKIGKNKTTKEQKEWIDILLKHGNCCKVCYGSNEAIKTIEDYLNENIDN